MSHSHQCQPCISGSFTGVKREILKVYEYLKRYFLIYNIYNIFKFQILVCECYMCLY